jgi:hypothetical protein
MRHTLCNLSASRVSEIAFVEDRKLVVCASYTRYIVQGDWNSCTLFRADYKTSRLINPEERRGNESSRKEKKRLEGN